MPLLIEVRADSDNLPVAVWVDRRPLKVAVVADRWKVEEEWWRESPVSRLYYEVLLEDGRGLTLFQDLAAGRWFRQRVG